MILVRITDPTDNYSTTFGPFASEGAAEQWAAGCIPPGTGPLYETAVTYGTPDQTPDGTPGSNRGCHLWHGDGTSETLFVVRMGNGDIVGPFGTFHAADVFCQRDQNEIVDVYRPLLDGDVITEPFSGENGWGILTVWFHEDDRNPNPSCMGDLVGEFYGRAGDYVFDLTGEFHEGR